MTAAGGSDTEPQMPACKMGLVWPNAQQSMGMIASLSRNECALTALQNHAKIGGRPAVGDGDVIAYSYCEVSASCGCLAGNDFCLVWGALGPANETDHCNHGPPDPCFCSDYVQNLINANSSNSTPPIPFSDPCEQRYSCDTGTGKCTKAKGGNFTSNATCATNCVVPAPPPPPCARRRRRCCCHHASCAVIPHVCISHRHHHHTTTP